MIIPNFNKPSDDCFLFIDRAGKEIKNGDILVSNNIPIFGSKPEKEEFPVTLYEGKPIAIIKSSFMLSYYAEAHCNIKGIQ